MRVNDVHKLVRDVVFDNLGGDMGLCFSPYQTTDAGPRGLGNLFHQDDPFLMVEVRVDDVEKIGPGVHTLNRVHGALEITYHTKDMLDDIGASQYLEDVGNWFAQKTIDGIVYREYIPTGDGRDRGFQTYAGTVVFQFETQPTR